MSAMRPSVPSVPGAAAHVPTAAADGARRLATAAPLHIDDGICLAFRRPGDTGCRACAEACPTQALAFDGQAMQLQGDCLGCGRCQAACPSGAAWLPGFAMNATNTMDAPTGDARREVRIDCWKGSPPDVPDGVEQPTLAVPCLLGVPEADWVALRARSLPTRLRVIDRGWCAGCTAGAGLPLARRIDGVNALLASAGVPSELQLAQTPVIGGDAPAGIPDPVTRRRMGRRAFFTGLLQETVLPLAAPAAPAAPAATAHRGARTTLRRQPRAGDRRRQLIHALSVLTRAFGRPFPQLPAALFFRVSASAACAGHGVCAAHCPTGALTRSRDATRDHPAGTHKLAFDSLACIGCGHCQTVCPEGALRLDAEAGYQTVTQLARHAVTHCVACGSECVTRIGSDACAEDGTPQLCDACFKSRRLARSAFEQLFGARG